MQETYDKTDEDATDATDAAAASGADPDQGGDSTAKNWF